MVMRDDDRRPREPRFGPAGPRDPYADRVEGDPQAEPAYADPEEGDDVYAEEGEEPSPPRRGLVRTLIVAAAVIGFGGIIVYSYTQGDRVGTEVVAPVLRADPSPTKIRPEQPGGMDVPHQDKLVYERLNPGSTPGEARVERLLPPPESPMDRPRAAVEPELSAPSTAEEPAEEDVTTGIPPEEIAEDPAAGTPVEQEPAQVPADVARALVDPPPVTPQPAPVTAASPDPAPAPSSPPQTAALPPAAAEQPDATPPAGGTARVQVGAVDSEAKAKSEWARLQRLHAAELAGLGLTVQRVDLGAKGVFHRIQGGPVSDFRAAEICAALKEKGAGCIVVR